jgi:hypothetical protein
MIGKKSKGQRTARGGYSYAELELALGAMLGADAATQQGALRGRLKRLSTLGVPGSGPGKGSRRLYSWEEVVQLAVALLMEDAGLDPVVVAKAITTTWHGLANKAVRAGEALPNNPMLLTLRLSHISGPWRTGDPVSSVPRIGIVPFIDERARAWAARHKRETEIYSVLDMLRRQDEPSFLAVRNLTDELVRLRAALPTEED